MPFTITRECPQCTSNQIEENHNFCLVCGFDLRPFQTVLPCCGRVMLLRHDEWDFCPFCGSTDPLEKGATA